MRRFLVLAVALTVAGCGISESEKVRTAREACAALGATSNEQYLDRVQIINSARREIGADVYAGSGAEVDRYLRFGVCVDFIRDGEVARTKADTRESALQRMLDASTNEKGTFLDMDVLSDDGSYLFFVRKESADGVTERAFLDAETMLKVSDMSVTGTAHFLDGDVWEKGSVKGNVIDGELEGELILRRQNLELAIAANFVNGNVDGLVREWFSNGQLRSEETYFKGKQWGRSASWFEDGSRESETIRSNGIKQEWKTWAKDGELRTHLKWVNGEIHGGGLVFGKSVCYRRGESVDLSECGSI